MKKLKLALVASAIAVIGTSVHAAVDGELDTTSTGSSIVTIIKDNAVMISNVNDLNMQTHSTLAADEVMGDPVCVFSSTGGYNVRVTSSTNDFVLNGAGTNSIPFSLTWAVGTAAGVPLAYNTALAGLAGDNTSLNCDGGTNATFTATVPANEFNAAAPDTYTATISLVVSPE